MLIKQSLYEIIFVGTMMDQKMLPLIIEVLIQEYAPLGDISTSCMKKLSLASS